jgi:hypothetical protein
MSEPVLTFFMSLRSQPSWLAFTRQQRADFIAEVVQPIFASYPAVKLRFYDAEAFSGRCTDMAVFETADIRAYTFLIDALRDTPFFGLPHFAVLDVIPAIENSYREYDAAMGVVS